MNIYFKGLSYRFEADELLQIIDDETFILGRNYRYGIINKDNEVIVEFLYDFLYKLNDDYYIYSINNKIGILDKNLNTVLSAEYTNIQFLVNI